MTRRFADGEHQHTIHVGGRGSVTLYLPIVPLTMGPVSVDVTAVIPGRKLRAKVTILVEVRDVLYYISSSYYLGITLLYYYCNRNCKYYQIFLNL